MRLFASPLFLEGQYDEKLTTCKQIVAWLNVLALETTLLAFLTLNFTNVL